MSKRLLSVAAITLLALAGTAAIADSHEGGGTVGRTSWWSVNDAAALEEGLKKHNALHAEHGDDWAFHTWSVISGKRTGGYMRGTFGHAWADFDNEDAGIPNDAEDAAVNINPYIESATTQFWSIIMEASSMPKGDAPAPYVEVIEFHIKGGAATQKFMEAITRSHEAIQKTGWADEYIWYDLQNGGWHSTVALILPRDSFAEFAPPEKPFPVMLAEGLGEEEAGRIMQLYGDSIEKQYSYAMAYRPDLSYMPGAGGDGE